MSDTNWYGRWKSEQKKPAEKVSSPSDVRKRWGKILLDEKHPSHGEAVAALQKSYREVYGDQMQDEEGHAV